MPGNYHFKIPGLFQVFHDRTNPVSYIWTGAVNVFISAYSWSFYHDRLWVVNSSGHFNWSFWNFCIGYFSVAASVSLSLRWIHLFKFLTHIQKCSSTKTPPLSSSQTTDSTFLLRGIAALSWHDKPSGHMPTNRHIPKHFWLMAWIDRMLAVTPPPPSLLLKSAGCRYGRKVYGEERQYGVMGGCGSVTLDLEQYVGKLKGVQKGPTWGRDGADVGPRWGRGGVEVGSRWGRGGVDGRREWRNAKNVPLSPQVEIFPL